MENNTAYGQIIHHEVFDVPCKFQVSLTMDTTLGQTYSLVLEGDEALSDFLVEHGVETIEQLEQLVFALDVSTHDDEDDDEADDEAWGPGIVSIERIDEPSQLAAARRALHTQTIARAVSQRAHRQPPARAASETRRFPRPQIRSRRNGYARETHPRHRAR